LRTSSASTARKSEPRGRWTPPPCGQESPPLHPRLPTVLDQVSSHFSFPRTCSPCPQAPPPPVLNIYHSSGRRRTCIDTFDHLAPVSHPQALALNPRPGWHAQPAQSQGRKEPITAAPHRKNACRRQAPHPPCLRGSHGVVSASGSRPGCLRVPPSYGSPRGIPARPGPPGGREPAEW